MGYSWLWHLAPFSQHWSCHIRTRYPHWDYWCRTSSQNRDMLGLQTKIPEKQSYWHWFQWERAIVAHTDWIPFYRGHGSKCFASVIHLTPQHNSKRHHKHPCYSRWGGWKHRGAQPLLGGGWGVGSPLMSHSPLTRKECRYIRLSQIFKSQMQIQCLKV